MPLQATSGAASYDAFGGGVAAVPQYIEDVFSTYLYTGNGGTNTITNGIDLSTKGGLVWIKSRSAATNHNLFDTAQGATKLLHSNTTAATVTDANSLTAFNTTGFTLGSGSTAGNQVNVNTATYVSWAFRKQPKFFDVETYTGNAGTLSVSHALGSKPGCIIIKSINPSSDWLVITRKSDGNIYAMYLNDTIGQFYDGTEGSLWTSTSVSINWLTSNVSGGYNDNGTQYVMYLFAHDAGGFGLTGTDNVISCGSMTTSTPLVNVNLGYEPQWVMWKRTDAVGNWGIADNMRGMPVSGDDQVLIPNLSNAESLATRVAPNATGFTFDGGVADGSTFIYIAIRRGPMKVPTDGTNVFAPVIGVSSSSAPYMTDLTSFTVDAQLMVSRTSVENKYESSRLQGTGKILYTNTTGVEEGGDYPAWDRQTGVGSNAGNTDFSAYITYNFRRAPSFFDEVCYTGTSATQNISHNLGVVPELMIIKDRTAAQGWPVYNSTQGNTKILLLNSSGNGFTSSTYWNSTTPTSSVFTVGTNALTNSSGSNFVAYLFATCAGVSKVGSYTGTGTTKQVDCGFAAGARFVLIKRTDSTGDWYVWDSARGIVSGNDPYLLLNSTAAEVTTTDYIDTYSAGFEISSTAPAAINASGGSFIFLAIA